MTSEVSLAKLGNTVKTAWVVDTAVKKAGVVLTSIIGLEGTVKMTGLDITVAITPVGAELSGTVNSTSLVERVMIAALDIAGDGAVKISGLDNTSNITELVAITSVAGIVTTAVLVSITWDGTVKIHQ